MDIHCIQKFVFKGGDVGYVVVDMVAGVDSFAGTLHAQFDMTCIIVEPTMRSLEVYTKYIELAAQAGTADNVRVIGNKIRDIKDEHFIETHIPKEKIIGYFTDDPHIRNIDQTGNVISISQLHHRNRDLLGKIFNATDSLPDNRNDRLKKIWELHKRYVAQGFIKERYGDLSGQIDTDFTFIHNNEI